MSITTYTTKDFKDRRSAWRTTTLFEETLHKDLVTEYTPLYALCDEEKSTSGLYSLKYLYLQLRDSQEYLFAQMYLGGWDHWQSICKSWTLSPHIEAWRKELKLKLRSEYLYKVREIASGDGPAALQAVRYLMEADGGGVGSSRARGRPSKGEKEAALKQELDEQKEVTSEALRLGLN